MDFDDKRFSERHFVETLDFSENYTPEFINFHETEVLENLHSILWHRDSFEVFIYF